MSLSPSDITKEKPLQDLLAQMKELLRSYQYEFETKIKEKNGSVASVELVVRIQTGGLYAYRTRS